MGTFVKAVVNLIVPEYSITILTLIATFFVISSDLSNFPLLIIPILSYLFVVYGFNSINAVFDKEIDKISKPDRPLPSGKISIRMAKTIAISFILLAILISLFSISLFVVIIMFIVLTLVYTHPKIYFRKFFWSTSIFGPLFYGAIPFLCVVSFFQQNINFPFLLFFIFLIFSISNTKDIEDMVPEKKYRIKSLPQLIGSKNTIYSTIIFLLASIFAFYVIFEISFSKPFLVPSVFSLIITIIFSWALLKNKNKENVKTQSKIVSALMVLVILIQLLFSIFYFF